MFAFVSVGFGFYSTGQEIGWEESQGNYLLGVEWDLKPQPKVKVKLVKRCDGTEFIAGYEILTIIMRTMMKGLLHFCSTETKPNFNPNNKPNPNPHPSNRT